MRTACLIVAVVLLLAADSTSPTSRTALPPGEHPEDSDREISRPLPYRYLVFLPSGEGEVEKRWPLILFLHGAGERGDSLDLVAVHGPPRLVRDREDFPFIVVSPQLPRRQKWSPERLAAFLDGVVARYPVDMDRIYLTGLSMGGDGTWAVAAEYPERFAAIVPISGAGDPRSVCALKDLPVWAFHGASDAVIPARRSRRMVEALQACGGNVRLTVYPDVAHDAWTRTYDDPALYAWLLRQRRQRP
jgi:predicted peptidase